MSLGDIKNLAQKWSTGTTSVGPVLDAAFDRIGFTDSYVDACIDRMRQGRNNEGWVIKDNIWGMISVDPQAAQLFDSPLLQRLRWIHQLGFSYLVYPSAEHSRFPHSLGVYHVVTRFLDSIDRLNAEKSAGRGPKLAAQLTIEAPNSQERLDLTHAAILHDIGHLPFSHATEKILQADKQIFKIGERTVDDFMFDAEDALKTNSSLSESISLAIVTSKRFERFYTQGVRPGDPDAPARIAALIAGFRTNDANRALPDVISSGLDADKIDYLWRDAEACKISLGIDVARVFLRSMFIRVPADKIPAGLNSPKDPKGQPLTVFVVNASGIDTIEEITFARASMYQRVYQHQVTRSAERLLGRALADCLANEGGRAHLIDALQIWTMNDSSLLAALQTYGSSTLALGVRLRNRQLPKRACVFGQKLVDPLVNPKSLLKLVQLDRIDSIFKQLTGTVVDLLKEDKLRGEDLSQLERQICEEAARIRDLVTDHVTGLPKGELALVTVLSIPNLGHNKVSECFVLERDGTLSSSRDYSTSKELADAAEISKGLGYVYADDPWRELVFLALRSILYNYSPAQRGLLPMDLILEDGADEPIVAHVSCLPRFRLDLERTCRRSKLNLQSVGHILDNLVRTDYFDKRPGLAPRWKGDKALLDRLKPLTQFNGQHGWAVTDDSILAFVNQFRPSLRDKVARLLEQVRIVDRSEVSAQLRTALERAKPDPSRPNYIAPMSPNSGQFLRMLLEQELQEYLRANHWTVCKTIAEALGQLRDGDLLVLCDDNASSGAQAETQLRAWFGQPRATWPEELREERGIEDRALSPNDQERLRAARLALAVCATDPEAATRLPEVAATLSIAKFEGVHSGHSISAEVEIDPDLRNELDLIGRELLLHCRWSKEHPKAAPSPDLLSRCAADALGYGGKGGLMATLFSVPASTITALWCPGTYNGEPWVPLFLRRGYFDHLVLA